MKFTMSNIEHDDIREYRIEMKILIDAYSEDERALSWYYYLQDNLNFPFKAKWMTTGTSSSGGDDIKVVGMSPEEDCENEIFVEVLYTEDGVEDTFPVSLSEIEAPLADSKTCEAIADWHYWVARGYEF
jgi:hypothetical protein